MKKILVGLLVLFWCASIGTVDAAKKAGTLRPTHATSYFLLSQDATFGIKVGIGMPWTWGLHASKYVPRYENDEGIFYEGDGTPVISFMNKHSMGDYAGGIFVPTANPSHPYLYYYFKPDESTYRLAGPLVAWMIKSGSGKIEFSPPRDPLQDAKFLETLKTSFHDDDKPASGNEGAR